MEMKERATVGGKPSKSPVKILEGQHILKYFQRTLQLKQRKPQWNHNKTQSKLIYSSTRLGILSGILSAWKRVQSWR